MIIEDPIITRYNIILPMTLKRYSCTFNMRRFRNGSSRHNCLCVNNTPAITPVTSGHMVKNAVIPSALKFPIPSVTPPKASALKTNEDTSNLFTCVSNTLSNVVSAMINDNIKTTNAITNIVRHPNVSTSTPAIVGAMTGAAPTDNPYHPITVPLLSGG